MPRSTPPFISSLAHSASDPFRLFVESVADYALYFVDLSGAIASWNPAAARMYGYLADEIIGKPLSVVYTAEQIAAGLPEESWARAMRDGHLELEVDRCRQDRSRFAATVSISEVIDLSGARAGFSVVTRDITERQKAELAVRRERAFADAILNSLPGIFYMFDATRKYVRWNRHFEQRTGYAADDIATLDPLDLIDEPDRALVAQRIDEVFKSGESEVEAVLLSQDGRRTPYCFNGVRATLDGATYLLGMGLDNSSGSRARESLRQAKELFQAVVSGISDTVFVKDRDGRYLLANPAAARVFGASVDAVIGQDDQTFLSPDDVMRLRRNDTQVMTDDQAAEFEEEVTVGGERRTFLVGKSPYRNASGAIIGVLGVAKDISERKAAELMMNRQRDLLRVSSRMGRMGAWEIEVATQRVIWSPELLEILELEPDVTPDSEFAYSLYLPEHEQVIRKAVATCVQHGTPFDVEVQARTASGNTLFVRVIGECIRDVEQQIVGAQGAFQDITDRRRAADELALRFNVIQAASQGIVIVDATRTDFPMIFVNAGFERMTGYQSEEVIGRNCRFLQGPDTDPAARAIIRTTLASRKAGMVELVNYRRDGTPFWNQLLISPIVNTAGTLTHYVGVQVDITERRRLEQQVTQSQKMEAVGLLAGGVAHDFNNLLTIINGYAELLLMTADANDPDRELLLHISEAGVRASGLTAQLLAFSRQQVLVLRVVDVNAVVTRAELLLQRLIGEDVELVTRLDARIGRVKVDAGQLEQVLMNLAINARDAMPTGGKLTMETSVVELDANFCRGIEDLAPGGYVMMAVSDTGTGISAALRSRIFEPFFTTKPVGRGTGLGLATVHGIIKQSHGHITVYSEENFGTTFKVYLPVVQERLTPIMNEAVTADLPSGNETVLLVEDDASVREFAAHIMKMCGYRVLVASNGETAMALCKAEPDEIHLVVTDVVMPKMSGRELAEQLAITRPACRILFLSGYTDDVVVRHGVLTDDFAFLQKPFSSSALARKVRAELDR